MKKIVLLAAVVVGAFVQSIAPAIAAPAIPVKLINCGGHARKGMFHGTGVAVENCFKEMKNQDQMIIIYWNQKLKEFENRYWPVNGEPHKVEPVDEMMKSVAKRKGELAIICVDTPNGVLNTKFMDLIKKYKIDEKRLIVIKGGNANDLKEFHAAHPKIRLAVNGTCGIGEDIQNLDKAIAACKANGVDLMIFNWNKLMDLIEAEDVDKIKAAGIEVRIDLPWSADDCDTAIKKCRPKVAYSTNESWLAENYGPKIKGVKFKFK